MSWSKGAYLRPVLTRYATGVVLRERERLAEIFRAEGMASLADRIMDTGLDQQVFRWMPENVKLHDPDLPESDATAEG